MTLSLPNSSFVPVVTERLRAPVIVWTKGGKFNEQWAADNAFCMRQSDDPADAYTDEERPQLADRYGGRGMGYGGGSGRCATFGSLQIKGVGRTPLVTHKRDPHHDTGTVWRAETAYEVIWSEIFAAILPHGVVPPLAIVMAKGDGKNSDEGGRTWKRTVLLREFALRPAHYLRNTQFNATRENGGDGLCLDACRTRDAIRTLHLGFDCVFGKEVSGTKGIEKINLGLRIMAERFAAQIAASFAKRMFHGALSCSNIALDGRFMDFGVANFVESYRRRSWQVGSADQWTQDKTLLGTLHLLSFHIQKYLQDDAKGLMSGAELTAEFDAAFAGSLEVEMLKMTGVPQDIVAPYPLRERQKLFNCMRKIYSHGADEIFVKIGGNPDTVGSNPPPRRGGQYDLNTILAVAATCADGNDLDRRLNEPLSDTNLRNEFAVSYGSFVDFFVSRFDLGSRTAARTYIALQANRLNADLSFLKREVLLDKKLEAFEANSDGLGDFIVKTVERSKYFLQPDHPDLPGRGVEQQLEGLLRMGTQTPDFVVTRLAAAAASQVAMCGMKWVREEYGT